MAILSKGCKPHNSESHNSLKLSFTNIWGLCSNFVDCKSFLQSNLHESIDTGSFCVSCCLPLIRKNYVTHMHGFVVYMKRGLPFAQDVSLENSANSYLCFDWLYFIYCLTSFSSVDHLLCLYLWLSMLFHVT